MFAGMTPTLSAVVSLAGLLIGAAVAIIGALYNAPTLQQLGATIVGGALGMFVPSVKAPGHPHTPLAPATARPARRPTLPAAPGDPHA